MNKRKILSVLGVAAVMIALAGCGSSGGSDSSTKTGSGDGSGASTTAASSGGSGGSGSASGCDKYTPGKDGVIQTFCDGSATVKLNVGGKDYTISGGTCATQMGYFSVNAGVVTSSSFSGAKPEYFGSNMPEANGAFGAGDHAFATFAVDGKGTSVPNTTGTHDAKSGSFYGTTLDGATKVTGTFTC